MPESNQPTILSLYTEDANGATVQLEAVRSRRYGQRFGTVMMQHLELMCRLDRPSCYWRCLMALQTVLDPVQWRRVSATDVRVMTGMSGASVERGLTMLAADKVIFCKGTTAALSRRLNNNLIWMARADAWANRAPDPEVCDGRGR